jgi:hypothetical protein
VSCIKASSLPLAVNVVFLVAKTMVGARCTDTKDHTHTASPTTSMIDDRIRTNQLSVSGILLRTPLDWMIPTETGSAKPRPAAGLGSCPLRSVDQSQY